MQAHSTVTPGIGQRTAFQRSDRVPTPQIHTSLSSWPTRIGVRTILVHVGAHEMHVPVGHCLCNHVQAISRYTHLGRTSHDARPCKWRKQASSVLLVWL